jgi:hypothetical protein
MERIMKNKNRHSRITFGFVFAFFIITIFNSLICAEELKIEEFKKVLAKRSSIDVNTLRFLIKQDSNEIPACITERSKSEKWVYHFCDSKDVALLAVCRPQKHPGIFWDPEGNTIESKSGWSCSRTVAFELAVILERPKMENESKSPDGKYYSLYGWPAFDPNNPPTISYVCGIGEWEDIGDVNENGTVGGYKISDVKDVSPGEKQIDTSVAGNFSSDYLIRLIAVDKNGKKFPTNSGDSFPSNKFSIMSQCFFGISKNELSHFVLQRQRCSTAIFSGFAIEPKDKNDNKSIDTVRWVDAKTYEEFFNINDIVRFDWDKQIFELRREKSIKLKSKLIGLTHTFTVVIGKDTIYSGVFVSPGCSIAFSEPSILFSITGKGPDMLQPPLYRIDKCYPAGLYKYAKDVNDVRFSENLKMVLAKYGKLSNIDANNYKQSNVASCPQKGRKTLDGEPNEVFAKFQNAIKDSNWNDALEYCSDKIKAKAKDYNSPGVFFKDMLPIDKIIALKDFKISGTSSSDGKINRYSCEIRIKDPNYEWPLHWELETCKQDEKWVIEFPTKPLNIWLKHAVLTSKVLNRELKVDWEKCKAGYEFILTPLEEKFTVGKPMRFRIEMKNISNESLPYTKKHVTAQDPMEITGPNGEKVDYLAGPCSIGIGIDFTESGEIVLLADNYDAGADYHIVKPGKYIFQFRGDYGSMSNKVEIEVEDGQLSDIEIITEKLKPIVPAGWKFSRHKYINDISFAMFKGPKTPKGSMIIIYFNPKEPNLKEIQKEAELLGQSEWGPVYIKSMNAEENWPNYKTEIKNALGI